MLILKRKFLELKNFVFILNTFAPSNLSTLAIKKLEIGMRLAQDLRLDDGFLVASSGADIDSQLLKVIQNYDSCYEESPFPKKIQVTVPLQAF